MSTKDLNGGGVGTAAVEPGEPRGITRTFRALGYRDFRFLWFGQIANSAAIWTEQVARPLLIIHLVPDPAEAAIHLGLVLGARTMPQLAFGLLGGVFADWFNRRTLLLLSKTPYALVNFLFAAIILTGNLELWHVYATTILKAVLTSFDQPARQALIPSLVEPQHVANAVALNSASMQTMRIGGAPLAGVLVAIFDFGGAFLAVALFSSCAVLFTIFLRVPPQFYEAEKTVRSAAVSFWEGARYGWTDLTIRGAILLTMLYFLLGMAYLQVFAPLLAEHIMGIGRTGYSMMIAVAGVGGVIGLLVIATLSPSTNRGKLMLLFMALLGVFLMAFALTTYTPWPLLTFLAVGIVGMLQSSLFALANTVLLQTPPIEMRGRIMGLLSLDRSTITAGGMIAGFLSASLGPQLAQTLFGAACIVFAVVLGTALPSIRKLQ